MDRDASPVRTVRPAQEPCKLAEFIATNLGKHYADIFSWEYIHFMCLPRLKTLFDTEEYTVANIIYILGDFHWRHPATFSRELQVLLDPLTKPYSGSSTGDVVAELSRLRTVVKIPDSERPYDNNWVLMWMRIKRHISQSIPFIEFSVTDPVHPSYRYSSLVSDPDEYFSVALDMGQLDHKDLLAWVEIGLKNASRPLPSANQSYNANAVFNIIDELMIRNLEPLLAVGVGLPGLNKRAGELDSLLDEVVCDGSDQFASRRNWIQYQEK